MSRIGKKPVALPKGVTASVEGKAVKVKGPKGEIKAKLDIEVAGASASAVEAVNKAGGSVVTTFKKKVHMNKKGTPGKRAQRRVKSAEKRAARSG
jgi:ribosomal protein L6P/L9E